MLVAIVSQNSFAFVFVGYRTFFIAQYVAKWGIAQMCLCELSTKGGIAPFGGSAKLFSKVSRDMGYRSDSTQRAQRSKKFEISIEIENFDRE